MHHRRRRRCHRRRIRLQLKFIALLKMGNLVGQSRIAMAVRQTIRILNFGFIDLKLRSSISKPTESNYYLLISTSTTHTFGGLSFSAQAIVRPQNKNTQSLDRQKKYQAMNLHSQSNDLCKHHNLHRHEARAIQSRVSENVPFFFGECEMRVYAKLHSFVGFIH